MYGKKLILYSELINKFSLNESLLLSYYLDLFPNKTNITYPISDENIVNVLPITLRQKRTIIKKFKEIGVFMISGYEFTIDHEKLKSILEGGVAKKEVLIIENDYLNYWNSLDNVRKHRAGTKTYNNTIYYLELLEKGEFGKEIWNKDKFITTNGIDKKLINHKFTKQEIEETLTKLSMLFSIDYLPRNKSKLPKNLQALIYNPESGYSRWFSVYNKPPKMCSDPESKLDFDKEILDLFLNIFDYKLKDFQKYDLIKRISNILLFRNFLNWDIIERKMLFNVFGRRSDPIPFIKMYIKYLNEKYNKITMSIIGDGRQAWDEFIKFISDEYGVRKC